MDNTQRGDDRDFPVEKYNSPLGVAVMESSVQQSLGDIKAMLEIIIKKQNKRHAEGFHGVFETTSQEKTTNNIEQETPYAEEEFDSCEEETNKGDAENAKSVEEGDGQALRGFHKPTSDQEEGQQVIHEEVDNSVFKKDEFGSGSSNIQAPHSSVKDAHNRWATEKGILGPDLLNSMEVHEMNIGELEVNRFEEKRHAQRLLDFPRIEQIYEMGWISWIGRFSKISGIVLIARYSGRKAVKPFEFVSARMQEGADEWCHVHTRLLPAEVREGVVEQYMGYEVCGPTYKSWMGDIMAHGPIIFQRVSGLTGHGLGFIGWSGYTREAQTLVLKYSYQKSHSQVASQKAKKERGLTIDGRANISRLVIANGRMASNSESTAEETDRSARMRIRGRLTHSHKDLKERSEKWPCVKEIKEGLHGQKGRDIVEAELRVYSSVDCKFYALVHSLGLMRGNSKPNSKKVCDTIFVTSVTELESLGLGDNCISKYGVRSLELPTNETKISEVWVRESRQVRWCWRRCKMKTGLGIGDSDIVVVLIWAGVPGLEIGGSSKQFAKMNNLTYLIDKKTTSKDGGTTRAQIRNSNLEDKVVLKRAALLGPIDQAGPSPYLNEKDLDRGL